MQTHILLHGPSGCGKTLIAEALANENNMNFLCIKGPELLSKYIGGSEAAIRDLFERAEIASPCIVLFDEFDSIAPVRGHDSTGVTDRVVNQLLTMLDGAQRLKEGVHIVATTSRPDMIDPALLRPGRLDCHIFCDYPDVDERIEILNEVSKRVTFAQGVNLEAWSTRLNHFSGADIRAFIHTAHLKSIHKAIAEAKSKPIEDENELVFNVDNDDLELSFEDLRVNVEKRYEEFVIKKVSSKKIVLRATLA